MITSTDSELQHLLKLQITRTQALAMGARAIDTASVYRNEVEIGQAIQESGVARADLFITSKLGPSEQVCECAAHTDKTGRQTRPPCVSYLEHPEN